MRLRGYDFLRKNCNTFTVPCCETTKLPVGHIEDEEVQEMYWDVCRNAQQMCIEYICTYEFGGSIGQCSFSTNQCQ